MDRTKPPVLTSPWKMGFFVALMLVSVSIGVAFFVAKSFGVVWPNLAEWGWGGVFQGEGFVFGLTPIMVMVVLSSLFAYFIITAGVRKYRRYLDSGKDYRHLMQTLHEIEDLNDPEQLALLDNYEELREFLAGVSNEMVRRRDELDEREKALQSAVTDAERGRAAEVGERVNEQAQYLVTAVTRHPDGNFESLQEITLPSLKKIEEAVRRSMQEGVRNAVAAEPELSTLERDVAAVMREIEENSRSARDIEGELQRMAGSGMPGAPDAAELRRSLDAAVTSFEAVDRLSQSLAVLGEEAKGVAINTALKASSGKSSQADVVKLAEDVKDVAFKFQGTAKSYAELLRELRGALTNVEVSLGDTLAGANSYEGSMIGSVADRIGRWAERSMLLYEKARMFTESPDPGEDMADMSTFERTDNPFDTSTFSGLNDDAEAPAQPQPFDQGLDGGFETPAEPSFETEAEPTALDTGAESGFEDLAVSNDFDITTEDNKPVSAEPQAATDEFETMPSDSSETPSSDEFESLPSDDFETASGGRFHAQTGAADVANDGFDRPDDNVKEPEGLPEFESLDHTAAVIDEADGPDKKLDGLMNDERDVFDDASTQDEMFAELDAEDPNTPSETPAEPDTVGSAHGMSDDTSASDWGSDGLVTGSQFEPEEKMETQYTSRPASDPIYDITTEDDEAWVDEAVMDLYELGAEDFDPAVHQ